MYYCCCYYLSLAPCLCLHLSQCVCLKQQTHWMHAHAHAFRHRHRDRTVDCSIAADPCCTSCVQVMFQVLPWGQHLGVTWWCLLPCLCGWGGGAVRQSTDEMASRCPDFIANITSASVMIATSIAHTPVMIATSIAHTPVMIATSIAHTPVMIATSIAPTTMMIATSTALPLWW